MLLDMKERIWVVAYLCGAVAAIFFAFRWLGVSEIAIATVILVVALYLHAEYILFVIERGRESTGRGLEIMRSEIREVSYSVRARSHPVDSN